MREPAAPDAIGIDHQLRDAEETGCAAFRTQERKMALTAPGKMLQSARTVLNELARVKEIQGSNENGWQGCCAFPRMLHGIMAAATTETFSA